MWDLVKGFGAFFKARKVNTDSTIFKLHYQATFTLLLVFTLILAANQYVGKPIRCMTHMDEKPEEVLDTFCWIHSTYTITSAFAKKVGVEVAYPGVESSKGNDKDIKVYRFYQWVSFCLVFQCGEPITQAGNKLFKGLNGTSENRTKIN
ncbi:Innexin shaking-B [Blattella germanica]|nr:Innexin shaking-B [Blattella germanica]